MDHALNQEGCAKLTVLCVFLISQFNLLVICNTQLNLVMCVLDISQNSLTFQRLCNIELNELSRFCNLPLTNSQSFIFHV